MLQLLDIAPWPDRPNRPHIRIEPDTTNFVKPIKDSVIAPNGTDSIIPQDIIDSCKQNVIDTLHSAVNWLSGTGTDGGSTLLWTSLVVLASLSLCFYFVWSYRRQLQNKKRLA